MENSHITLLRPSLHCCCCGKTLKDVGGCRVVCSQTTGLDVQSGQLIHTWGQCWTDESRFRALQSLKSLEHPWICQRCANVGLCSLCGSLTDFVGGLEILHDDGSCWHRPLLPVGTPKCTNRTCPKSV